MANDKIVIKGAREHNLKNVDLTLPREKLIVMTGLSGSGKGMLLLSPSMPCRPVSERVSCFYAS